MSSIMNIALSGMQAASLRINSSANNIANAQSTKGVSGSGPFIPQDVVQISDANGGTIASTRDSTKPPLTSYDPDIGTTELPNVDLAEELVKVQQAKFQYISNLKVIENASKLLGEIVNFSV